MAGWRRLFRLMVVGLLLGVIALAAPSRPPEAASAEAGWQSAGLLSPVSRIHPTVWSGVWALSETELFWSATGDPPWFIMPALPEVVGDRRLIAFEPFNDPVFYVTGGEGVYRTADFGDSWTLVFPRRTPSDQILDILATPTAVYVAVTWIELGTNLGLYRSHDGGGTWETLSEQNAGLCGWAVPILAAAPHDPERIFRVAPCLAGRSTGSELEESRDGGLTWRRVFRQDLQYPTAIAGGQVPDAWYLAANRDGRAGGGAYLFASRDDGRTWSESPIDPPRSGPAAPGPRRPNQVSILTADGGDPARLWAGFRDGVLGVAASRDGGHTWATVGETTIGPVNDLSLDPYGYLYAATDRGLFWIAAE